ncbi:serine hydrolase domain-containing protein [Chitinophaga sancti]|uniref:CubicO group peptidase, beta-lactamase class C family n=1 Tax=Chitinophaga sancti TaxID=1004 RepID=A0A1K1SMW1_9BACT|nr:serine hydrolase domain-containing protein [Chitinophaga sancti]WQD60087.1 serine hydrolase domain-containing protein [Chitinophaga sancti]WQG87785.1 serine hydrolase domain-containing protein [Chitinophaga sancti]SFW85659.1 CubicO group peptidase, beta-lactamase class C family [Chitinophaga sancti]
MKFILITAFLFSCLSLCAQDFQLLNGNILMAKNGKVVHRLSYGYADFPSRTPNNIETPYNLASISKTFTATAILQLMEKGKLKLDDPFQQYFPEFPFPDITIKHLLSHTSGLPDLELFEPLIRQYPDTIVSSHILIGQLIASHCIPAFKPGDEFRYCNNGFVLLSLLVEKISQQSFEEYLQDHIFRPAHMYASFLYDPTGNKFPAQVSKHVYESFAIDTLSRVRDLKRYRYTDYNNDAATGASNIITTVQDMLLFDKAFFGFKLLKPATVQLAITPVKLNNGTYHTEKVMDTMEGEGEGSYGLGWELFDQPAYGKGVGHGGFKFGLATFYYHNLDNNQTIIAFDNTAAPSFGAVVTNAQRIMNDQEPITRDYKKSLARIYVTTLIKEGTDAAATQLTLLQTDTAHYYLSELEMNKAGYEQLYDYYRIDAALEIFKLNCLLFPRSFNTYDSYGEALNKAGKKKEAIALYERSILINPGNEGGIKELSKIKSR